MNFQRLTAIAFIAMCAFSMWPVAAAEPKTLPTQRCDATDTKLCAGNGASCGFVHDRDNIASAVCRWSSATSAGACKTTSGLWTTATSQYARNHPDAVQPGSDGACIAEVKNVQNRMSDALVVTEPTAAKKRGPYKRPRPPRRETSGNYVQQLDISEAGGCRQRSDYVIVVFLGDTLHGTCAKLGPGVYNNAISSIKITRVD